MLNNISTESFYNSENKKNIVNLYKTSSGDYCVVRGISDAETSENAINQSTALSPGLKEFFKECLRKPMYCDMSNNGAGINYIFCETLKKCAICIGTVSITNTNYSMNYKIYTIETNQMPETMPNLTGSEPVYEFSTQGQLLTLTSTIDNLVYNESNGAPGTFTALDIRTQRTGDTRLVNKYSICVNKVIRCNLIVNFELIPPTPFPPTNPLNSQKFTFDFEVDNFTWDMGGNLTAISAEHTTDIGNNQTALVSLLMDQDLETLSVTVAINGQNFVGSPPTQNIITANVSIPMEIMPLSDFSVSTDDDFTSIGGECTLAGWAAYNTFKSAVFEVSFSDMFPGVLYYSPEPIFR